MYYEIYADSLFLLQFFMNLYLLGAVNHMLYHAASWKRVLAGAALGAICAIVPLFLPIKLLYGIICSFLLSFAVMSIFTFRTLQRAYLFRIWEKMLTVMLLLGSLLLFLLKLIPNKGNALWGIIVVLALGAVCYMVVCKLTARGREEEHSCRVVLEEGDKRIVVDALLDTGNSLVEPISGKPVAVLEESAFLELFSGKYPELYRVIPYRSVGKANGILQGYLLKGMIVEVQGVKKECKDIYVAVSSELISEKNSYRMILNPHMLEE